MHQVTAELLAGTGGGILGVLAGHPFDTVKVRIQAMPSMHSAGMIACLRRTVEQEGPRALYKGILSPVGMCGILNAIVFATEKSAARLLTAADVSGPAVPFLAGCIGGLAQCPALCFMDAAKCNLQVEGGRITAGAYAATFRRRCELLGLRRAFLPGLGVTVAREVPSYGVYFLVYDSVKERLQQSLSATSATLLAGGLAGVISLSPFHPLDTAKSRLQVATDPQLTATGIIREGLRTEGAQFLFRGFAPFVFRTFLLNAATFYGFESTLSMLQREK
eukprot:TRINITY_DN16796_c0_g2_i1.p1 TRINITY_DN16796_c0_g2~~TRINITY_DN16796_c0_g2_i1.p1  ORF type:complete len:277 (-),score=52.27 TRINITY_DN16796_c0_g2_i1:81-911(-)